MDRGGAVERQIIRNETLQASVKPAKGRREASEKAEGHKPNSMHTCALQPKDFAYLNAFYQSEALNGRARLQELRNQRKTAPALATPTELKELRQVPVYEPQAGQRPPWTSSACWGRDLLVDCIRMSLGSTWTQVLQIPAGHPESP